MNIDLKLKVEDLNARYAQAIDDDKLVLRARAREGDQQSAPGITASYLL